jgi:hypothetical protein
LHDTRNISQNFANVNGKSPLFPKPGAARKTLPEARGWNAGAVSLAFLHGLWYFTYGGGPPAAVFRLFKEHKKNLRSMA